MANTYATLDPANKSSNLTLSNGNLTATNGSATWDSVISTISKTTGKWYWECTVNTIGSGQFAGVTNSTISLTSYVGANTGGYSYLSINGNKYNSNSPVAYGGTYTTGDVIGVAFDAGGGTIEFFKNNTSQGVAYTGITGTQFAGISLNTPGSQMTVNFGATTLVYTPPSGYNAGLYDSSSSSNSNFLAFM